MYIYIWKTPEGQPFYVGLTKTMRRANPRNAGGRNWLCRQKLSEIGVDNVVVELHATPDIASAQELERKLITEYGRIQLSNGPLTNLQEGGNGAHGMSEAGKESLRQYMLDPNHPIRSPEARAKQRKRMNDVDVREKFIGDANPAKKPEVRAKIKARWEDPAYRKARKQEKTGRAIHSAEEKQRRREKLLDPANPMREFHKVLNSDPVIAAKRAATLRSPEQRKRQSEAMKAYWAKKRGA
jgi:hypothetical protein